MAQPLLTSPTKKHPNYRPRDDEWSEADVLILVDLWDKGYSMGAIGNRIGRTRNAVAGQITKIRKSKTHVLANRDGRKDTKVTEPPTVKTAPKPTPVPKLVTLFSSPKPRIRLKLIESPTAVTFQELDKHHCRWPLGDPLHSDFRFCGIKRVAGTPYCQTHLTLAEQPQKSRLPRPTWR